ncbi:MAG TPA: hypothetical protein VFI54_12840 [Solirubrobacteraceae bacterium]|nr:hypothetical protein [Solirubrobacteraceae bacterium]
MSFVSTRLAILASAALAVFLSAVFATPAAASHSQVAIFEDDLNLTVSPASTFAQLRLLGVSQVRLAVRWQQIAPDANSRKRPKNFNAADPAAYPAGAWSIWDQIVTYARDQGIQLNFDLMGGAPLWATGPGVPDHKPHLNWDPSPTEFGKFVRAVATRYNGAYNPTTDRIEPGNPADLPRVGFWSVWNEPDYGPSLAPQGRPGNLKIENSPRMYRNLVSAAVKSLQASGHGRDPVLIGELAPRGAENWGVFSGMKPVIFLRALYCVDSNYRPLRGGAAALRGCPATAAGSRRFRADNPGLFRAAGVSVHPYMRWYPPNKEQFPDPNSTSLGEIGNLTRALDRLQRVYGSTRRYPIYSTEFGYITTPPKHDTKKFPWVNQNTAAYYLNWAEYLSWRNPRISSFAQYLLYDPLPVRANTDFGGYASGLVTFGNHVRKATYAAWRLPLYLPVTTAPRGRRLEIWGCARPAHFAQDDTGYTQLVEIQFQRGSRGPFKTLRAVRVTDPHGYFDLRMSLPASGTVRLAWTFPASDELLGYFDPLMVRTAYSRSVRVTLR